MPAPSMGRVGVQLASLLALACLLPQACSFPRNYCASFPLASARGAPAAPGPAWASLGPSSRFDAGPCLRVSGSGVAPKPDGSILILDDSSAPASRLRLPSSPQRTVAPAELLQRNGSRWAQAPVQVASNPANAAGQFLTDGTFLSIGGTPARNANATATAPATPRGTLSTLAPCAAPPCQFMASGVLAAPREYATAQLLGDGRVAVLGGASGSAGGGAALVGNPSVEYFPSAPLAVAPSFQLPLLAARLPYTLYPVVHLLPSGRLFVFAGDSFTLFDTMRNREARGPFPSLAQQDAMRRPVLRTFPFSGTSALFPLTPAGKYAAEVMLCGGASLAPARAAAAADRQCYRISPEAPDAHWVAESMALRRVMPSAVLLPDGHLLILNGAQQGHAGTPNAAARPALTPELYSTAAHAWHPGPLAQSRVPRVHHSSAALVADGSVFVSGSNPNRGRVEPGDSVAFPTEFRSEFFVPPYKHRTQPTLVHAPTTIALNANFMVKFFSVEPVTQARLSAVLCHPGYATGGVNQGMRNVELEAVSLQGKEAYLAHFVGPPSRNVAPPTWYWFFVLVDGTPTHNGQPVFVA